MSLMNDGMTASYKIVRHKASELPDNYIPMVYSKFLRSLRDGNSYFKLIDSDSYFTVYHKYLEALLARPEAFIRLACLADEPDTVLGWALLEPNLLHYMYVNVENRQIGIAKSLLEGEKIDTISHITHTAIQLWPKKMAHAKFNPFA